MMLVRAYLAPSSIEGLGVFSHDNIRKGDVVWRFDTRFDQLIPLQTLADSDDRTREFLERYGYDMPMHPGFLALDADEGRFMNHSDAPNLDFSAPDYGVALVDIPAGVELTCDYREFTVGDIVFQPPRHQVATGLSQVN
ncbi:SET domain-containing protein [Ponticaulis profundi]|uniref:SET domain-containing protein n=1 Tax=Ponticaulis profundi TaxID=2665222 RepID=A0ABW1S7U2_9PROT